MKYSIEHTSQTEGGFTLLYATLVSALLLSISLAVFNIGNKELLLSSTERDSQFAFYIADTGIECALYWDFGVPGNSPFPLNENQSLPGSGSGYNCAGIDISNNWTVTAATPNAATTTFEIAIDVNGETRCVDVIVGKQDTPRKTVLEARGYNTSCSSASLRRVERALRVNF